MKQDVYERIPNRIVADMEQGVRPWTKPSNAEHAAGRITRPLRFNGVRYEGIDVLMLWGEAVAKGCAAPIWMNFRQAVGGAASKALILAGSSDVLAAVIGSSVMALRFAPVLPARL